MTALALYRGLTSAGLPVIHLMLRRRMARGKEDPARFSERLGIASQARPDGRLIWLHAASVGEALSILALIERLRDGPGGHNFLITTGTVTSARLLADRLPNGVIHQYVPVDRAAWVRRFLDHWRPDAVLWVESELWPNLVTQTAARGIPIALVNGRMSARSHRGWLRARGMARHLLSGFHPVLAQDARIADRFKDLGAQHVTVTGSLKYAAAPLPCDDNDLREMQTALSGRTCWVAASTHDNEEISVIAAHRLAAKVTRDLLTIIVPRHPSRGDGLADEMRRGGLVVAQRSKAEPVTDETQIYLADTMGELGLFYRLAELVFVGGSLVPRGCQNLLEPAQLDCAVLHGPDTSNFEVIAKDLHAAGAAIEVADRAGLSHQVAVLLADDARRANLASAARQVVQAKQGIIDDVIKALAPVLGSSEKTGTDHARA
jgi:3-deoxy-D-manno-octulosonic-acid transferase